jgi:positive regulator of sigma E activity
VLGALGLGLGFLTVRVASRRWRDDARFQPVVLRRVAELNSVNGLRG